MGRLERKLDQGLIAMLKSGVKPRSMPKPLKKVKPPRSEWTYRGYWRNAHKEG